MLEVTQKTEHEFFWQEADASNLLAFLYLFTGKDQLAKEQLYLTLEHAPNNLNAIVGMARILETQKWKSEADERVDQFRRLTEDSEEMDKQSLICRGEIAYACSFIGPDFYIQAVDRYKDLLQLDRNDELSGYVIRWHYRLAYTYNRMLNKGHRAKLVDKLGTENVSEIFNIIHHLYDIVINSSDEFYRGKAMIDLVDTYKKCETFGNGQQVHFPYSCSPDDYVKSAMDAAPSDPHVLERCGRHYRQRASNEKDLEEAIAIFDALLKSHPSRHVAWHHKGLACRALWHVVGEYDAAKLYNNCARKGQKRGLRKQIRGQARYVGDDASATNQTKDSSSLVPGHQAAACQQTSLQNTVAGDGEQVTAAQDVALSSRKGPESAPKQLPTLRPRNRHNIGDVPRQLKKPDFFDRLRTSNPPVTDNISRTFLEKSKECFKQAKKMTKGTCSPYIVDLARCLISLGLSEEAETEFQAASKLMKVMNENDATYLYEQWAIFRHNEGRCQMKDVASIYRLAILYAVRAREKSRIAFYNLRDLLCKELEQDATNVAVTMEYEVLNNSVERYSECKEMLVRALEKDEETRDVAWQLIKLLHARRHPQDASAAFMYLTALHEARQLDLDEDYPADTEQSTRELLIDVVYHLVRDRRRLDDETNDRSDSGCGQTFGEIFRWIVGTRRISDCIKLDPDSPRPFANSGEICIAAPSYETPGVSRVVNVLRYVCGIAVVEAFVEGNCDIPCGCSTLEGLLSVAAISQAVIVVLDSNDTRNWMQLRLSLLEELMTQPTVKTCLVLDERADCTGVSPCYFKRWPCVDISGSDCTDDDIQLAYTLLKTLLCQTNVK